MALKELNEKLDWWLQKERFYKEMLAKTRLQRKRLERLIEQEGTKNVSSS